MYKEYITTKKIVEDILRDYPETRNSDRLLFLKVFEKFGLYLTENQKRKFLSIPVNFESIRRSRQKIQNQEHRFLPVKSVLKARIEEKQKMHDAVLTGHTLFEI